MGHIKDPSKVTTVHSPIHHLTAVGCQERTMLKQEKISDKQYELLLKLYREQGKKVTPEIMQWLSNMPVSEGRKYIDKWIEDNRKRVVNRRNWKK